MAAFVDTMTYLKYGNKPSGKARAILWPVLVHQVLYPEVQQPKMNLFQKVVMRLIRANTFDAGDIAELTGFHINLVKLIQAQLLSRGWIDDKAIELTESGLKAIGEEDDQSEQLASGYLFQDAVSGKFWPRIDNRLAIIEPDNPSDKFPKFSLTRKTGKVLEPFKPSFKPVNHATPKTQDTMRAWQDYRSDYRIARQLYTPDKLPKQIKLSGLTYQSEQPESAWIFVWITASHNSRLWSIKDPFDIRDEAWWLTGNLPELLENDKNLSRSLSGLIEQPEPENQTVSEWLISLRDQASLQVMMDYPWVQKEPDIADALSVVLTRQEMLENGQNHKNDLEAAITECQKLLEVLMQWLIKSFQGAVEQLPKSKQNDTNLNRSLLTNLNLPAFTEDVIATLSRQKLQMVIRAFKNPTSSLKALVFAAALGTIGTDVHPLKVLNSEQLDLQKLLALADLRNQTSHGNSRYTGKQYTEITVEVVQENIEFALQFTEQFKEWIRG
ncbi:HEPN domain-containing protein [Vibrio sp. RM-69-4]|uniref:HEPN domain-containing protein n=1 Tax=Vibrio sp. RM-69-4 TaxID=2950157 RepID=UPI00215C3752|nr:HEPN domain-containing protein [Vibrio sp. RM-69-4]MCR9423740.1 HEPN domain-containing protein [Vibrio sp. RM-69-4]